MKLLYSILLVFLYSFSFAYEPVPEDAKEKEEDVSKHLIANQAPEAKSRLGKNTIINLSGIGAEDTNVVLVDKNLKRLYIAKLYGDNMEVIQEFPILTGRVDGNKLKRGDEKTPEGVYYVLSYSSGEELVKKHGSYALIYGAGSFPLNYPNIIDRIYKKTGGGIWLHGVKPDLDKTYTQGCVAMNNTNFSTLHSNIKVKTPVIIAENLMYEDNNNYHNTRSAINKVFASFIKSWETNDKKGFTDMVHTDFKTFAGATKRSYTSTKTTLMDIYPKKYIRNTNIKYFIKDRQYAVVDTDQFYCAANLSTFSNKKYYFLEENGSMKLISEEISHKSIHNTPFLDKEIEGFVNNWVQAWQAQDINKYMDFYDTSFRSGRENYNLWKTKKEFLFSKKLPVTVNVSDIKWRYSKGVYTVEFVQEYTSGDTKDKGIKKLELSGCPSFFKIKSEKWREI